MEKYFLTYKKFLKMNLGTLFAYRGNAVNSIIASVGWGVFSIISILLLTSRTSSVFGWTQQELLILTAVLNIVLGIFRSLFSRNFEYFSLMAQRGDLDMLLTKPLDTQFLISFRYINYAGIFRIVLSILLLIYLLLQNNIQEGVISLIFFLFVMALGMVILYSIWFSLITITIWFPRASNILGFLYSLDTIIRYPQEMSRGFGDFIFFIIFPLTLIVTSPTKALLHTLQFDGFIIVFVVALFSLLFSRFFFRLSLRSYTSVSS